MASGGVADRHIGRTTLTSQARSSAIRSSQTVTSPVGASVNAGADERSVNETPGAGGSPFGTARLSELLFVEWGRPILRYMPKYRAEDASGMDLVFRALGDPSRRAMLERLARGPASVTELARPFDMALPTVVQHLRALENSRIVTSGKVGRVRSYQLNPGALAPAMGWMSGIRLPAEKRLDRLEVYLAEGSDSSPADPST